MTLEQFRHDLGAIVLTTYLLVFVGHCIFMSNRARWFLLSVWLRLRYPEVCWKHKRLKETAWMEQWCRVCRDESYQRYVDRLKRLGVNLDAD